MKERSPSMKNWVLEQIRNFAPLTLIILVLTVTHKWWQPYFSTPTTSQSQKTTIQEDKTNITRTKQAPHIDSQTSNEEIDSSENDYQQSSSASNMTSQTLKPVDERNLPQEDLPHLQNSQLTPGAIFVGANREMICVRGYSKSVRNVPLQEKKAVYREYGIKHHKPREYEVDHLVSLELGGSNDISNLWPEPYEGEWGARTKDKLEDELHHRVCAGTVPLAQAQQEIATDWVAAYKKYVGNR